MTNGREKTLVPSDYDRFVELVYRKTGIPLHKYKRPQMERRLSSLCSKHGFSNFQSYFQAIDKDEKLLAEFLDRMTINVSEFFRNPGRWEVICGRVIPELLKKRRRLKIWSAACSTGEEPYTIAMIVKQFLPLKDVQILATDIDARALETAKKGIYHKRSLQSIPAPFIHESFREAGEQFYEIVPELKKAVTFQRHNLLEDPFGQDFDLIVCRNVMIYFTEEAKVDLYRRFSEALRPQGILFVGSTEQIFNPAEYGLKSFDTFMYQKAG
jgi:chemotaxis protein methyltransferase CheR